MREHRIVPASAVPDTDARPRDLVSGDRRAHLLATLEQGVTDLMTAEGFQAYLRMQATFHAYSFGNVLLIAAQSPQATLVNSYKRWQTLGRQVRKGEKGISIFVPYKRVESDPDTGEPIDVVTGFGVGHVWDVRQTDGDPLPTPPPISEDTSSSGIARHVNLRLSRWLIGEGLLLESKDFPGHAGGFYHPAKRQIVVRRSVIADEDGTEHNLVDPLNVQKTKTLVHEAAHYDAETVAEGAAFVVLAHHGLDTAGYSFPYLATWAQDVAVLKRNLAAIQQTATTLIGAIAGEAPPAPAHEPATPEPVPDVAGMGTTTQRPGS